MDAAERAQLQDALVRLQGGDRRAFDPAYAALWPVFLGIARRPAGADAEDVAQDALLKLFAHVDRFDPERDALAWALGIVAFEVYGARNRRARRKEQPAAALDPPEAALDPEQAAVLNDLKLAAAGALGTLRPADVEVLERAARGEREPGPTFRKRLERALARLRLAWRSAHELD